MKPNTPTTLNAIVETMPADERLYIGAKKGSGFIFIGTKEAYYEEIVELSDRQAKRFKEMAEDHKAKLLRMVNGGTPQQEKGEKFSDYCVRAAEWGHELISHAKNVNKYQFKYDSYVPYQRRIVVDIYKKEIDPDEEGTVILMDSDEVGQFWMYEEYVRSKEQEEFMERNKERNKEIEALYADAIKAMKQYSGDKEEIA